MRRLHLGTFLATVSAAGLLGLSAAAFACTNLATIESAAPAGPAGTSVAVTGASFAATGNPVVLHWNGATGPELATAKPDQVGNVSMSVVVPKADPGYYVIVATQTGADGKPVYGTPARTSFQVVGPDGKAPLAQLGAPQQPSRPTPASDSSGVVALTIGLGAAGVALFGAGFYTLVRHGRRREAPVPVRHD